MLVISRKQNESLRISQDITVRIIRIDRDSVRIGVDAPRDVPVHREELYQEIVRTNIEASKLPLNLPGWSSAIGHV